jgi:hypothetical protein
VSDTVRHNITPIAKPKSGRVMIFHSLRQR